MSQIVPLVSHLAPDTISRLERAAKNRYNDGERSSSAPAGYLGAVYLFGYSAEMCLAAAYYRGSGFAPNDPIDRDTRHRRMAQARQIRTSTGEPLMSSDPHPLVGWARFLEWQRSASPDLTDRERERLSEAIHKAELIYKHWRPELGYKIRDVVQSQFGEVRKAAMWFIEHRGQL